MTEIKKVASREILDSRGNPTVEVSLTTEDGVFVASVPSGASTGKHEALELRDGDERYHGKGVRKAVQNSLDIGKAILGMDVTNQKEIDNTMIEMDGTENKSNLGANAILPLSMAVCRAGAKAKGQPLYGHIGALFENKKLRLPSPFLNVVNGGEHAGNDLDIQEFMIVPETTFMESIRMASETYVTLKKLIKEKYGKNAINVGDEGGFAPPIDKTRDVLDLLMAAISENGYEGDIKIAIDAAASEFYKDGKYNYQGKPLNFEEMIDEYKDIAETYPIVSLEDPMSEDDWPGWSALNKEIGEKVQIVGDDLLVTNPKRIEKALEKNACNALLLKINQIGTITEALKAASLAKNNKWGTMVSHRSGETTDNFISDLAVGLGCGQIKSGASCRGERVSKYNRLLKIEEIIRVPEE